MAPKLVKSSKPIEGPDGVEATLRWYDDGSVRLSLTGTPWSVVEAFIRKSAGGKQATIRLRPGAGHPAYKPESS
jgi:hypothetical protein